MSWVKACERCGVKPVDRPDEMRPDGRRGDRAQFCYPCLDRCHEATDFAHICVICATPEEARQFGLVRVVDRLEVPE